MAMQKSPRPPSPPDRDCHYSWHRYIQVRSLARNYVSSSSSSSKGEKLLLHGRFDKFPPSFWSPVVAVAPPTTPEPSRRLWLAPPKPAITNFFPFFPLSLRPHSHCFPVRTRIKKELFWIPLLQGLQPAADSPDAWSK